MGTWRAVVGWEGLYEVSDLGMVRSLRCGMGKRSRPRPLKQAIVNKYQAVTLSRPGAKRKTVLVHTLVLTAFVGPRPHDKEAAHEDGVRTNNALGNLSWKTHLENCDDRDRHGHQPKGERCHQHKLTADQVRRVRDICRARSMTQRDLANSLGVTQGTVSHIATGRNWSHLE